MLCANTLRFDVNSVEATSFWLAGLARLRAARCGAEERMEWCAILLQRRP